MIVQDLLDELRGSILRDKSALKSGPEDSFWSDDALIRYIDEAHKRFARLTLCIVDSDTVQCTQVTLATTVDTYSLDETVLRVISARHQDDTCDLHRLSHPNAVNTQNPYTSSFEFATNIATGKPFAYSTDEGLDLTVNHAIKMRFFGVPTDVTGYLQTGKIVYLRVARAPLNALVLTDLNASPEIAEEYHLDMLEWAAYRALRNVDIDAEDRKKAMDHRTRFNEAVLECRAEIRRKLYQPIQWQFGGNGFSYIR